MEDKRIGDLEPGSERWRELGEIFERALDAESPETVLEAVEDSELRAQAQEMWRNHEAAHKESVWSRPVEFDIAPVFRPGQKLAGRFQVKRLVGKGGMGEVYLAQDERLEQEVAIKTVARLLMHSEKVRQRFLAEVQNARRVTHRNVCRIYEFFEEDNVWFFVMEYLDGPTLREWAEGTTEKARLAVLRQIAEGLSAAHATGIVHGDLKPGNVIVSAGRPVITDFGLARAVESAKEDGMHLEGGTGGYMAPELAAGGVASIRSDIYAFGKLGEEIVPGARMWARCTRVVPTERPASMEEVIGLFPQDHTRRNIAIGAVAAAGGAAVYWWPNVNQFVLATGARLLVNRFRASEAVAARARLARGVFLTALQQSPKLRIVADADLVPTILRMNGKDAGGLLEGDLLQRLLSMHRAEYWIDARLEEGINRYSLFLRIVKGAGAQLIWQQAIRNVPGLVQLAELGAAALRRSAGESEASLAANPAETTTYTSRVPEALERYHEAMNYIAGNEVRQAIPLLESAIGLDPSFAQAHSTLGLCEIQFRRHEKAFRLVERGWRLAAKLPEREKVVLEAAYYNMEDDPVRMVESARRALSLFPDEPRYRRNVAQLLCRRGEANEGVEELRRALEQVPDEDPMRNEYLVELCEAGQFGEAVQSYERAMAEGRASKALSRGLGLAYMGLGRAEMAQQVFESATRPVPRLVQGAKILKGDLSGALVGLEEDLARSERDQNAIDRHQVHEYLCGVHLLSGRMELAAKHAMQMTQLPLVPISARFLQCAAFWAGRSGNVDALERCRKTAEALQREWPNGLTTATAHYVSGLQERSAREWEASERSLLRSLGSAPTIWAHFDAADLFAQTGRWNLAEDYWRKYAARTGYVLKLWFPGMMLLAWHLRGQAAHKYRDTRVAQECAGRILAHWGKRQARSSIVRAAREIYPGWEETKGI